MQYIIKNTAIKAETMVSKILTHTKIYAKNSTKYCTSHTKDEAKQTVKKENIEIAALRSGNIRCRHQTMMLYNLCMS